MRATLARMLKLMFALRRRPELTREAFHRYWLEEHGPLVRSHAEALQIVRYVQSHALPDEINEGVRASRGAGPAYDGITEVWFDDLESMGGDGSEGAVAAAQALLEDEAEFLDFPNCRVFLTEEHVIF